MPEFCEDIIGMEDQRITFESSNCALNMEWGMRTINVMMVECYTWPKWMNYDVHHSGFTRKFLCLPIKSPKNSAAKSKKAVECANCDLLLLQNIFGFVVMWYFLLDMGHSNSAIYHDS